MASRFIGQYLVKNRFYKCTAQLPGHFLPDHQDHSFPRSAIPAYQQFPKFSIHLHMQLPPRASPHHSSTHCTMTTKSLLTILLKFCEVLPALTGRLKHFHYRYPSCRPLQYKMNHIILCWVFFNTHVSLPALKLVQVLGAGDCLIQPRMSHT